MSAWGDSVPLVQPWRVTEAVTKMHECRHDHGYRVVCYALARSGHGVVFGSEDKYVWVWNSETSVECRMKGHSGVVVSVAFSYDGRVGMGSGGNSDEEGRVVAGGH